MRRMATRLVRFCQVDEKPDIGICLFFPGERRSPVQLNGDGAQKFKAFGIGGVCAVKFVDSEIGQGGELAHQGGVIPAPGIQQRAGTLFVDVNEILHGISLHNPHRTDLRRSGAKGGPRG